MTTHPSAVDAVASGSAEEFASDLAACIEVTPDHDYEGDASIPRGVHWIDTSYIDPQDVILDVTDFWCDDGALPTWVTGVKLGVRWWAKLIKLAEDADPKGNERWIATYKVKQD